MLITLSSKQMSSTYCTMSFVLSCKVGHFLKYYIVWPELARGFPDGTNCSNMKRGPAGEIPSLATH